MANVFWAIGFLFVPVLGGIPCSRRIAPRRSPTGPETVGSPPTAHASSTDWPTTTTKDSVEVLPEAGANAVESYGVDARVRVG